MRAALVTKHSAPRRVEPVSTQRRAGRDAAVIALIGGVVALAAVVVGVRSTGPDRPPTVAPAPALPMAPDLPPVFVVDSSYAAGQSSGWHMHRGVHAVVVLAGTLTIYGADCDRQNYEVGQTYLGGAEPHLARNESSQTLEFVSTHVSARAFASDDGLSVAAPPGCDAT
jgi:quercetin dioxygenase-like cupin family protein